MNYAKLEHLLKYYLNLKNKIFTRFFFCRCLTTLYRRRATVEKFGIYLNLVTFIEEHHKFYTLH